MKRTSRLLGSAVILSAVVATAITSCDDGTTTTDTSSSGNAMATSSATGTGGMTTSSTGSGSGSGTGSGTSTSSTGSPPLADKVDVTLSPASGVSGDQTVNFAVPLQPGMLTDAAMVRVTRGGAEIASARRGLSKFSDGSFRSVQIQISLPIAGTDTVTVEIGAAATMQGPALVPVEQTLLAANGETGPRVWALLPATWLSNSEVTGPQVPEADVADAGLQRWATLCDYAAWDTDAFLASNAATDRAVWLYDRVTALYRGYARRGDLVPLASAYREAHMYRNRITGTGTSARNGIPGGAANDVKYQYAQNMAIHYLLTGDDRFREAAEDMALGMTELWPSPGYAGGADMWTERNAGFSLLAYVWALKVTDDQAATLQAAADTAVTAYLDVQSTYPVGYMDADARCFAHHGDAHDPDEGNPYFGCSPWMSAILADGLDEYAREKGGATGDQVRASIVKLGRILAREGRDASDVPYYWMGVDTPQDAPDDFFEHIGESAYIVAMAWRHAGANDAMLLDAANALVAKFATDGEVGQLRSFNWQCRSAVATPRWLAP